jgi:uncharacterized protein with ParB-like and HNH nuclease domain/predicted transport protein
MKAKESRLLAFLSSSKQFVIPIYQRPYRWEEAQCRKLWDDVLRAGGSPEANAHFVGSVVYIQDGLYSVTDQPALLLIDGQQRLTTFLLLIEAIARAQGDADLPGDFAARKLRHYYLKDSIQDGERAYKMLLSATDRSTLKAIIDGKKPLPEGHSIRIAENFALLQKLLENADLNRVCVGLSKILVVDISLDRGHDNPQLIFESLNSTGKELGQADLIRNYVLMGLDPAVQTRLYEDHWRPMELAFGQVAYANQFDSFMRHYLTLKTGDIPNVEDVYDAFKKFAGTQEAFGDSIEGLVGDIHRHAIFFCRMALASEPDKTLEGAFHDIRELKAEVTFPFLLELYADYDSGILEREAFLTTLRLVEAYIFRRIVCAIPTNSHNKTFSTFSKALRKDRYLDSIKAHFLTLPSYRRFPDDREFRQELERRDLYNFRNRSYWLRRLENHGRKERVAVEEYTIEHILPQNENLSDEWQTDIGPTWQWVRDTYLHTLGNLTLTAYNSNMSDKPFRVKRDDLKGFRHSPLHLNEGLAVVHCWGEDAIKARASRLSAMAVSVWVSPNLDVADLETFKRKPGQEAQVYSIADHPSLVSGPMKTVFDAFRAGIMALNPAIGEEFGKLYVSYSAEDTFVSIIPRTGKLRLVLNMPFPELQDARKISRDVTNIGHWSKGDVDLDLQGLADLPYVIGLVRQAFEWQLDGEGGD